MTQSAIENVLDLLRKIKNTYGLSMSHTPNSFLDAWSRTNDQENQSLKYKIALAIIGQIAEAEQFIIARNLPVEAEQGMMATINSLKMAFSIAGLHQQMSIFLPTLDVSLSSFAMLVGILRNDNLSRVIPTDVIKMIGEMEDIAEKVRASEIDPKVKETVVAHLVLLACMLRNIEIIGADAALLTFMELIMKIKRVNAEATVKEVVGEEDWSDKIKTWGKRIGSVGDLISGGSKLVEGAESVAGFLM